MLLRIICVNWPCTHIHINKCGYRILYAVIAYRMREPHTVCGRRIPYAGSRIPYAGSRIPYVNPPITQITNYMWLPHTGCGNRIQDAENRILYAVTPYLVDSHPICGARIQYAGTAYSMRDRIQYAGTAYSMRAWDQGKFTGVTVYSIIRRSSERRCAASSFEPGDTAGEVGAGAAASAAAFLRTRFSCDLECLVVFLTAGSGVSATPAGLVLDGKIGACL